MGSRMITRSCVKRRNADGEKEGESFGTVPVMIFNQISIHEAVDAEILLKLFPAEIWTVILEKVREDGTPEVQENVANASLFLRRFLIQDRVKFLFSSVMKLVKIPISDRLNCGLVCTSWNKTVKDFLQNSPSHFQMASEIGQQTGSAVMLDDPEKAVKFFSDSTTTHVPVDIAVGTLNPFLGRSVTFKSLICRSFREFVSEVAALDQNTNALASANPEISWSQSIHRINLLQETVNQRYATENRAFGLLKRVFSLVLDLYGHHIWYLNLQFPSDAHGRQRTEHYSTLGQCLQRTRNLKVLSVSFQGDQGASQEDMDALNQEIPNRPLHQLDQLEILKTENLPTPIFNELVRVNGHIRKLQINKFNRNYSIFSVDGMLPELKSLAVMISGSGDFLHFEGSSGGGHWNLEELYLIISNPEESEFVEWAQNLELVQNKWGTSLQRVEIQLPKGKTARDQKLFWNRV